MSKYPYVEHPIVGKNAFTSVGDESSQSQAAILLSLGQKLRGDNEALKARERHAATAHKLDQSAPANSESLGSDEDNVHFPVPDVKPTTLRVASSMRQSAIKESFGASTLKERWDRTYADCADQLYDRPTPDNAANLFELALNHPVPLVRLAAAIAYFPICAEPARLLKIIAAGVSSKNSLERDVAATALGRLDPTNPALTKLKPSGKPAKKARSKLETLMLVHGTWAANEPWWQKGGDFHSFVSGFRPDTYAKSDRFGWTGGYSNADRAQAAADLVKWVKDRGESGLDLIGHSHGANVMMLATASGMKAGKLILLSCPVHLSKYFPDFANCTSVHSVRVKMDLVILADGGGQKFFGNGIKENVLPIWFNHSATYDPAVWNAHGVRGLVGI